ncbi:MAG: response regulator [Thermoguttaceae bacterium]
MMVAALSVSESAEIHDDVLAISPTVFVVDPDPVTGTMVKDLLRGYNWTVQAYASGREFFAAYTGDEPGCLVLEQRIFDISGLQIQRRLAEQNQRLPMVYVTSTVDVSTAVFLMRGGAIHVLEKPLRSAELLNAIQEAVAIDKDRRREEASKCRVRESIAMLTRKERQFVSLVACAKSTKAIAAELNICSRAVELRRRGVMGKLGLNSSSELLKFAMLAWQEFGHYLESAELEPVAAY